MTALIEELRNNMNNSPSSTSSSISPGGKKGILIDEDGLILPRKLYNPCLESKEAQNLHRQIKWNAKTGINVLDQKSELEKAMEKRQRNKVEKEKKTEVEKTPFQKMLEERAKRLEDSDKGGDGNLSGGDGGDSGHCSPEPESEFLKVHAQLRHVKIGRSCH